MDQSLHRSKRASLDERLEQRRDAPFEWGFHDCFLFPLWCIHPGWAYEHFGCYNTMLEGFRYFEIRQIEGAGERICEWHHGKAIGEGFAHRGDLVLVDHPQFTSIFYGVHTGGFTACATDRGWKALPNEHFIGAWRLE